MLKDFKNNFKEKTLTKRLHTVRKPHKRNYYKASSAKSPSLKKIPQQVSSKSFAEARDAAQKS